jgi:hypothetical protein
MSTAVAGAILMGFMSRSMLRASVAISSSTGRR